MNRTGNTSPSSSWDKIEKLLGAKLPALPTDDQLDLLKDTSWVEDYVQQIIKNTLPKQKVLPSRGSSSEVFETHYYVVIKVNISYEENPLVNIRPDQVKIKTTNQKEQIIRLPCLVVPSTGRATYKDGILQINIRKRKIKKSYREVSVRYL